MSRKKKLLLVLSVVALAVVAVVIRLLAIHMYDLQIDEITYARFAQTIDAGELPRDFGGQAFFLHPPGYFAMLAIWRALFWHGGNIFTQYTLLRGLNVFLAGISTVSLFALTKVVTKSNKLGLLAAAIFTIDPFLIRQNTRSLMETATMLWLLIGLWLLFKHMEKSASAKWTWLGIGFVFGLAMVTKDVAINFLVLMFALMAFRKVGPERRVFRYLIPAAAIPYGVWLAIVAISGNTSAFINQKTLGIRRFLGLLQTTGFNASNSPSKSGTLMQTIPHYATSYGIMGLGAVAACWLLLSKDANRRRWGCVGTAATLLLAYLYVGGTFEEQYLYYLVVPSIISVIVGFIELWQVVPATYHRLIKWLAILGIFAVATFSGVSYVANLDNQSGGWQHTIQWADNNVPTDSTICVFGQGQFLLGGHGFNVCAWTTLASIQTHHVQYIVVSEKLTYSNYEPLNVKTFNEVQKISHPVYTYDSPDSGVFEIVKMNNPYGSPAPDTVTPPTHSIATAPAPTPVSTPQAASTPTAVPAVPGTLPSTGISLTSAFKAFTTTMIMGTASAYLFFYFRSGKRYRQDSSVFTDGYVPGNIMQTRLFSPEHAGSLAIKGVELW